MSDQLEPTAITPVSILSSQVDYVIAQSDSSRLYWYVAAVTIDIHCLVLVPWYRDVIGRSRLEWRAAIGSTSFIDLRLMVAALRQFDPTGMVSITFPAADGQPFAFTQSDITMLIMPIFE